MITRREFLGTAAAAAALAACGRLQPKRQPNIIFILTDDQRWDCLSCAGHPYLKTPNMDRIANEGVRFANMFCTDSLCSPSRASFLSGVYAHTHGVRNNFTEYPDNLPSYPKALKSAGYNTAYVGKWHMGENNDEHRSGFDYWASHKGQGQYYGTEWNIQGKRQKLDGYYTHIVTDLAVNWMKTAKQPFAIEIGHKAPHGIWVPEPKYAHAFDSMPVDRPATATLPPGTPDWVSKRIKTWHGIDGPLYETNDYGVFRRSYLATLLSVDDAVGQVFDVLKSLGELDNTLIAYAGDNGFLLGEHASIDKRTAWEESMRIPLLVRYPEMITTPHVVNEMVLNQDLAPSLVEIGARHRLSEGRRAVLRPAGEGGASIVLAEVVSLRIQLRDRVPVHAERSRRPYRRLEVHPLSQRRRQPRHREGGAVSRRGGSNRGEEPDRRSRVAGEAGRAEGRARSPPEGDRRADARPDADQSAAALRDAREVDPVTRRGRQSTALQDWVILRPC